MYHALSQDWLSARTQASPEAVAIIQKDQLWSYQQLDDMVDRMAQVLDSYTKPGDRVACLLPNDVAFVCLIHALARLGAVLIPINLRLTSREIAWQLQHSASTLLICDESTVERARNSADSGLNLILVNELLTRPVSNQMAHPQFDMANIQGIIFTSGTSGKPKGATLSFANHFYSATASAFRSGIFPDDRWLCCLPLYHIGGLAIVLRSCLYGTAVVIQDGFDVEQISDALDRHQVTLVSLVPTMLTRLLRHRAGQDWPQQLRLVLLGGAAPSQELVAECQARGIPVSLTYGLTEAASQVATNTPEGVLRKPGSVGRPLLFTDVRIESDAGHPLPSNSIGEIVLRSPSVMIGYDRDPESTAQTLRDGWLHTGDIGYLDGEGDLWVLQRRGDIIISGGENVYPQEVEDILHKHDRVKEACVVGIADAEWGQMVAAAVATHDGEAIPLDDLVGFCRQYLAGYKIPRQIAFLPSLPRTSSGKIQRQAVADFLSRT